MDYNKQSKIKQVLFSTDVLPEDANLYGKQLSINFTAAKPYPFIIIDNFLQIDLANDILKNFPIDDNNDIYYEKGFIGLHKRQIMPSKCNEVMRNYFAFFNSESILQFLEGLTSIEGLIPDPYFFGGGFHEIKTGGKLGIHADFRIHEKLHLNRRLNMIIYLNKDWKDEYGGNLELWDKKGKKSLESIKPIFNRCVVFRTDATSYHGHPEPLNTPTDVTRKSIALYYYTASKEIYHEVPSLTTLYRARASDPLFTKLQVALLRFRNSLKEYLPPIIYRFIRKIK
jgi:Rps23 Pro-64 3,4-dihydroxylase Tpa1-like proline 4-hydroxylase